MGQGAAVSLWKRAAADVALLAAFGVFMAVLGPYGTISQGFGQRAVYWLVCIVGGGLIGVAIDETLGRRIRPLAARIAADSVVMTPPVTVLVLITGGVVWRGAVTLGDYLMLLPQVFVVCVPIMALRTLVWREPPRREPAPEGPADAAFRQRLSARRREARLLAVQAEDHYLRVHTDQGDELITARFADALEELAGARGFRTHRSWWVAADAIEAVRWKRGRGEAALDGGLVVPVSRSNAAALKDAGWF
jgi:hypothetical protein